MSALIELTDVAKIYAGAAEPAIDHVSLTIAPGQRTAVLGPSGCGKSTLLHLIGGLDRPSRGTIVVGGVQVERLSQAAAARFRRAGVGFIFQFFHLLDDLTVRDNIAIAAELSGAGRTDARRRADELLAQLGLDHRSTRFPATLSGGERQRVAIARAVINRPAVLLADEPTGALDSRHGASVLALLDDLNRRGQTILLVTHDERLAVQWAQRIVRMADGVIVADTAAGVAS